MNKRNKERLIRIVTSIFVLSVVFVGSTVIAGAPTGADWFQMIVSPSTGSDNTGDGGTGLGADLNYYYVGQSATQTIQINSGGTDASNIWIDYDNTKINIPAINTGTYFPTWANQTISSGRIKSTGFDVNNVSSGLGTFGSFTMNFLAPTEASYATNSPGILDINIGNIGDTTESNISLGGLDLLDSAEDFQLHIWADTIKPFAENPSPANLAVGVAVDSNFTFDLRDTLNGEGDNTGVGTGVNTATGAIVGTPGSVNYFTDTSYSCSGIWNYNLCSATVAPSGGNKPTSIAGDTRNWEYNTTYTMTISNYQDRASTAQDQLGDTNGPNVMNTKIYTFTTESDTVAPQVVSESPARGTSGASPSANIIITVQDRKAYPSDASGVGVNSSSCKFNISSTSLPITTYQQGDATVAVSAVDYGYQYTINPPSNFAENETVYVSAYDCADTVGNVMTTDNWSYSTADSQAPYVDQLSPANDASVDVNGTISFHVKDDGGGVDLNTVVIYINGEYYSNGGGAISVTTTGTKITSATSLDFNGGNYVGDTTSLTGTSSDYSFIIDPQTDFTSGEAVPIIIYAKDSVGNIMQRSVNAVVSGGGVCTTGSSFCGTNTAWNGNQCIASGSSGGGGSSSVSLSVYDEQVVQVDEESVLVTWRTNKYSNSWVVYGTEKPANYGSAPNFDYENYTQVKEDGTLLHSAIIKGLKVGKVYHFRPISDKNGEIGRGEDMQMSPKFKTETKEVEKVIIEKIETPGETKIIYKDRDTGKVIDVEEVKTLRGLKLKVIRDNELNINTDLVTVPESEKNIKFEGEFRENEELLITIY